MAANSSLRHDDVPRSFFEIDGDGFRSTARATGPWDVRIMGGGPLAALILHSLSQHCGGENFHLVRLTTDFLRPVPAGKVQVRTEVRRQGRRLRVVEGAIIADSKYLCQASAVFCAISLSAPAHLPGPEASSIVPPDQLNHQPQPGPPSYTTSMDVRPIVHPLTGQLAKVWIRFPYPLLPGIDLTPITRAALASDAVSGFAFMTADGLTAINNDLSVYLHREPQGDWLCVEVDRRVMRAGIAVARASLHDSVGLVGDCVVSAIAIDHPIRVTPSSTVSLS